MRNEQFLIFHADCLLSAVFSRVCWPHYSKIKCIKFIIDRVSKVPSLSDLLNLPKVATPAAWKTGKARVLTNSECLRLLREKEEKKQQVTEEKEKRKQERELKKQQKEAEKGRREARKLDEREAEKVRKQAEKAQKEKEKAEKAKVKAQKEKERAGTKRQADGVTSERVCQRTK